MKAIPLHPQPHQALHQEPQHWRETASCAHAGQIRELAMNIRLASLARRTLCAGAHADSLRRDLLELMREGASPVERLRNRCLARGMLHLLPRDRPWDMPG